MIYTVTINPSVDYLVELNDLSIGKTNRAVAQRTVPGGKGINVSRVLKTFDTETKALGFIGGFTGEFIQDELRKEKVTTDFIETVGQTRINVKLQMDAETEINGQAPEITEKHITKLLEKLDSLKEGDILVLSGSVPSVLPSDIYKRMIARVQEKKVVTFLDTSGAPLKEAIQASPFLIKPNQAELEDLYGEKITNLTDAIRLAKRAVEEGVQAVLVSLAGEGAVFVGKDFIYTANVPKGTVRNSVGAGDSMVASFIYYYLQTSSLREAFKYSVAGGSATAFSEGFCTLDKIEELVLEISVSTREEG
ncbi:1-phosphofructokinase [Salipaludibacillus neizhouensis]|uniref:Tagatose-6-phosphate kinase n=1 Tax=Salipaludibacillus neizhouensis TaxID=885475 RepID=A0A3A9KB61_9BACI|nr:1-phosphofructokinase [Salipaludibacillus neizhouensis]RKL66813.1 1-phosphofructokinase [Salipaludibacillus neizhouensis]